MKTLYLPIILVLFASNIFAQSFTNYTTADGLLGNDINVIEVDSANNIWFGGASYGGNTGGVTKFDGSTMTTYTTADGLQSSFQDDLFVTSIEEDKSDQIWIGTIGGISIKKDQEWQHMNRVNDGLFTDSVSAIRVDDLNNIWIGYEVFAVSYFKDSLFTHYSFHEIFEGIWGRVTAIEISQDGKVWVATSNGLIVYNGTDWTRYTTNDGLPNNNIYDLALDTNNFIWVGTDNGASKTDGTSWTNYSTTDGLISNKVYSVEKDNDGSIWFGCDTGLTKFNGVSWESFTTSNGLISNYIQCLTFDNNDNLWIGTNNGVSKLEIPNVIYSTETLTICENELPYVWYGHIFIGDSVIIDTVSTDTMLTLTLNIDPYIEKVENIAIDENELPYQWHGHTFTGDSLIVDTVPGTIGCDTILTIITTISYDSMLQINCPPDLDVISDPEICETFVTLPAATVSDYNYNVIITNNYNNNGADASDIFPLGITMITYTATDTINNLSSTCSTIITVIDEEPPVWIETEMFNDVVNLQCGDNTTPSGTGFPDAIDNCMPVSITYSDAVTPEGCPGFFTIERTWTASDEFGNISLRTQNIYVTDSIPPTLICKDTTVATPDDIFEPWVMAGISYYDNCGIDTIFLLDELFTFGGEEVTGFCPAEVSRQYGVYDKCGNISTCTQTITVTNSDNCAACQDTVPKRIANLNNVPDSLWILDEKFLTRQGACCQTTDANGAWDCISFDVYLDEDAVGLRFDITNPAPVGVAYYSVDCIDSIQLGEMACLQGGRWYTLTFCKPGEDKPIYSIQSIPGAIVTDSVICNDNQIQGEINLQGLESSSIEWSVKYPINADKLLNYLDLTDIQNPLFIPDSLTPNLIIYEVCGTLSDTLTCGGNKIIDCDEVVAISDFDNSEKLNIICANDTVLYVESERCEVFVETQSPFINGNLDDVLSINNDSPFAIDSSNASGTYPVGSTIITWTIIDKLGNTYNCSNSVEVIDNLLPIITCPPDIVVNADFGLPYASNVLIPEPILYDNCPNSTLTWIMYGATERTSSYNASMQSSDTFNLGVTTVEYTITDMLGNLATCNFNIAVLGAPEIECQSDITVYLDGIAPNCDANIDAVMIELIDGVPPISWTCIIRFPDSSVQTDTIYTNGIGQYAVALYGINFPVGITMIEWLAENISGRDTCQQTITVIDTVPPEIICPPDTTIANGEEVPSPADGFDEFISQGGVAIDRCELDESSFILQQEIISEQENSIIIKRGYKMADLYGNIGYCEQLITSYDTTNVVFNCPPAFTIVNDQPEPFSSLSEFIDSGGSIYDNCIVDTSSFELVFEAKDSLLNYSILQRAYSITDNCMNEEICVHNIIIETPTYVISEKNHISELKVYPNPNSGKFKIKITGLTTNQIPIQIFNSLGEPVYKNFVVGNKSEHYVDLSNYPKGVYHLSCWIGSKTLSKSIIIN